MSKLKYHRAMTTIVTHSLLHLYGYISNQKGYVTTKERNGILVKFLKLRLKLSGYAIAKKDIKTLIITGRKSNADLEKQLWKLNEINLEHARKFSEADELYILLNDLYHVYGYPSQITDGEIESGVIYMEKDEIESGFDENNSQIRTLKMHIRKDDQPQKLIDIANSISSTLNLTTWIPPVVKHPLNFK